MKRTTRTVVQSAETQEYFVAVAGGYMEDLDYVDDGGQVIKWEEEFLGEMIDLGVFTDYQILQEAHRG